MYTPDNWVVIKFDIEEPYYRVLAGWSGGYLDSDNWRLNSGITKVEKDEDFFYFYGSTGSCYKCHKHFYGLRKNNSYIWNQIKDTYKEKVQLMPVETNWTILDYTNANH